MVAIAAGLAGVVSTSLEVERRVTQRQLNTRGDRLRARAEGLAKFMQVLTGLLQSGVDEHLRLQTISLTKANLDEVLTELVQVQQIRRAITIDDLPPIRRWLLLFVPARPFAWIIHFGFYFFAWITALSFFEFKEVSKILPKSMIVGQILAFIILAALLRYWAVMEMRWAEGFRPCPSPIRRVILWYRPASRRELIARAGLVFGIFQIGPLIWTRWISHFLQVLDFTQAAVTLIVFYAWSIAELGLTNSPVEMRFPRNLTFLSWPRNRIAWFWMICFYFMAACTVFFLKQAATLDIIPAFFRQGELLRNSAEVGITIGFVLSYLLPMYALNRILLADFEQEFSIPRRESILS
jgi:hypothetical protein